MPPDKKQKKRKEEKVKRKGLQVIDGQLKTQEERVDEISNIVWDSEFLKELVELTLYGAGASRDKYSNTEVFQVRVQPHQTDIIAGIKDKTGMWFEQTSLLRRTIIAVGSRVIMHLMEKHKGMFKRELELVHDLSEMERHQRYLDTKKRIAMTEKHYEQEGFLTDRAKQIFQELRKETDRSIKPKMKPGEDDNDDE